MILRLVERTDRIAHIPRILYHWRAHPASTAGGDAKPYAYVAARNAIAAHLERGGSGGRGGLRTAGSVSGGSSGRARRPAWRSCWPSTTSTASPDAAVSWLSQPHPTWNVVLAAPAHLLATATGLLTAAGLDQLATDHRRRRSRRDPRRRADHRRPRRRRRAPPAHANPRHRAHPRLAHPPHRLQQPTRHRRRRTRRPRPRRAHPRSRHRHPRRHPPPPAPWRCAHRWISSSATARRSTTSAR